jgi:hypothetical protein
MSPASDNPYLSDPSPRQPDTSSSPRRRALGVEDYLRAATAANTRRAHESDLKQFLAWGGTIPASPETVAAYLAERAGTLAVATLERHLASISRAHADRGLESPTRSDLVRPACGASGGSTAPVSTRWRRSPGRRPEGHGRATR